MAPDEVPTVKVLQLNAWGGRLEQQVIDLMRHERPDIVCLQEIIDIAGKAAFFPGITELQQVCGFAHAFHSPVFSFNFMQRTAHFGNAILSQLPFESTETIFTNLEYKPDFDFDTDDYNIRNLQHAVIDIGKTKLNILNHHGHHIHQHKNGDTQTLRQMQQIADYVGTLEGPVILCGDFNLAPQSESLGKINGLLANLSLTYKLKTTRNQLTPKTEVCDYVFVNDSVRIHDFRVSPDIVSDHAALIAEFDVPR
jgi:endonuclease/exonuclease/phosphatase family metal-dependent hydrolase